MPGKKHCCCCRQKRPAVSRSRRAELQFPVSRVERALREGHYTQRLSSTTPVFLAGVLEYLTSNILEMASMEVSDSDRKSITAEHVEKAVQSIEQLRTFWRKTPTLKLKRDTI